MLKGKFLPKESSKQYPDLENFAISAVLPLECSSTPHTQVTSTLSWNTPSVVLKTPILHGSSGSRGLQLGTIKPLQPTPLLAQAIKKAWTCTCHESGVEVFCVSSNNCREPNCFSEDSD